MEIYRRLAAAHPAAFEQNVAATLNNLGNVQRDLGEREAARDAYVEALGIFETLAKRWPKAFAGDLRIALGNYTEITPETPEDRWWPLWKEMRGDG